MKKKSKLYVISGDDLGYMDNRKFSLGILSFNDIKAGNNDGGDDEKNYAKMKKAIESILPIAGACAFEYNIKEYEDSVPSDTGFDLMDDIGVPAPRILINYPENGLSPKRQLEMVERLMQIVTDGISVVLVTNSTLVIQGVRHYAYPLCVETEYYLCERDEKGYKAENVTNDLNRMFAPMAEVLNGIVNIF